MYREAFNNGKINPEILFSSQFIWISFVCSTCLYDIQEFSSLQLGINVQFFPDNVVTTLWFTYINVYPIIFSTTMILIIIIITVQGVNNPKPFAVITFSCERVFPNLQYLWYYLFFYEYCVVCHNARYAVAPLALQERLI